MMDDNLDRDNSRQPTKQEYAANIKAKTDRRRRLYQAIEELKEAPRVRRDDRNSMAHALGALVAKELGGRSSRKMRELFIEAFKDSPEAAEVNYKKRKRFIRFDSERTDVSSLRDGDLHAGGRAYCELARAIARLSSKKGLPLEDREEQILGRMIIGTSYDSGSLSAELLADKERDEFLQHVERIRDKVLQSVNLDRYRELAQREVLSVGRGWPADGRIRMSRLSSDNPIVDSIFQTMWSESAGPIGQGAGLDLQPLPQMNRSAIMRPRVQLATAFAPRRGGESLFKIDVPRAEIETLGHAYAIEHALLRLGGHLEPTEIISDPNELERFQSKIDWREASKKSNSIINIESPDRLNIDDSEMPPLWMMYKIFFELAYDERVEQWRTCISQYPVGQLTGEDCEDVFLFSRNPDVDNLDDYVVPRIGTFSYPYFRMDRYDTDSTMCFYLSEIYSLSSIEIHEDPEDKEGGLDRWCPAFNGLRSGTLAFPDSSALDYVLTPLDPSSRRLHFELRRDTGYVEGAAKGSIGHAILANLAVQEEEDRVSSRLIRDARTKYDALDTFFQQESAKFKAKIEWLNPNV